MEITWNKHWEALIRTWKGAVPVSSWSQRRPLPHPFQSFLVSYYF